MSTLQRLAELFSLMLIGIQLLAIKRYIDVIDMAKQRCVVSSKRVVLQLIGLKKNLTYPDGLSYFKSSLFLFISF